MRTGTASRAALRDDHAIGTSFVHNHAVRGRFAGHDALAAAFANNDAAHGVGHIDTPRPVAGNEPIGDGASGGRRRLPLDPDRRPIGNPGRCRLRRRRAGGLTSGCRGHGEQRLAMPQPVQVQAGQAAPMPFENQPAAAVAIAPQLADLLGALVEDAKLVHLLRVGREVEAEFDLQILLRIGGRPSRSAAAADTAERGDPGDVPGGRIICRCAGLLCRGAADAQQQRGTD
jgi:hypothetical protein